ncbi:MAG: Rrf2 family transcriptional regulator [Gammaproteobacteria bacterium]|nr:Rrf2 family transcriptional regulator [Gammaproteobacteria bacterium]MDH5728991.1 Rrf2 family transcriptional regulator [Gammaproteobacteria bacterium]
MQLTLYTDYSLRVLAFLALRETGSTISEIAQFYDISRNHLVKVVHNLSLKGFIHTTRGKSGGIRLARAANEINIADVVRNTEPNFNIVECFSDDAKTCTIEPICRLKSVLGKATDEFIGKLEQYSLDDIVRKEPDKIEAVLQYVPTKP